MSASVDYFSEAQRILDAIGVDRPMHLLVHGGLRPMGGKQVRPVELVESLVARVGADSGGGCLLMPTYQPPGVLENYIYTDPLYDPRETPSGTGALTQIFMSQFPTRRSYHPWLAISAMGENAEAYLNTHHLDLYPHDTQSPFYKLCQQENGYILLLGGASYRNNSTQRIIESIQRDYPVKVFHNTPLGMRYRGYDGIVHQMQTMVPFRRFMPNLEGWGRDLHAKYPAMGPVVESDQGYSAILIHAPTMLQAQLREYARGNYIHNAYYGGRPAAWRRGIIALKRRLGLRRAILKPDTPTPPQNT